MKKHLIIYVLASCLLVACGKSDSGSTTPTPTPTPVPTTPTVTAYLPDGWKTLTPFADIRACATAVAVGDKVYAGLGYNGAGAYRSSVSNDWYEYDPATAKWTEKAAFPGVGRANATGFAIGSKIYVGLGTNYDANRKADTYIDFYEYDPTTDKWAKKADFTGGGRDQPASFVIGTKGYLGTGNSDPFTAASVTNDFYEYNPATDKWTSKASLTGVARCRSFGFAVNGKGYIGAGEDRNSDKLNNCYEYDPATDKWVRKSDFPEGNAQARGFDFGAVGLVAGGRTEANTMSNTIYQYNPADNTWTKKGDLATDNDTKRGRFYPVAVTLKSKVYIGLGGFGTAGQKDFYEYTPK